MIPLFLSGDFVVDAILSTAIFITLTKVLIGGFYKMLSK